MSALPPKADMTLTLVTSVAVVLAAGDPAATGRAEVKLLIVEVYIKSKNGNCASWYQSELQLMSAMGHKRTSRRVTSAPNAELSVGSLA
jgi:hypothetical protein